MPPPAPRNFEKHIMIEIVTTKSRFGKSFTFLLISSTDASLGTRINNAGVNPLDSNPTRYNVPCSRPIDCPKFASDDPF